MRLNRHARQQQNIRSSRSNCLQQAAASVVVEALENRQLLSAVVLTDQADYAPGSTALFTATTDGGATNNFQAGETIQFHLSRTDGIPIDSPPAVADFNVTDGVGGFIPYQDDNGVWVYPDADGQLNGAVQTNWYVDPQFLGASLSLTARGTTSGQVAQADFTDGNVSISNVSPNPFTPTGSNTTTITLSAQGSAYSGNISIRTGTGASGTLQRTLTGIAVPKNGSIDVTWDGKDSSGSIVAIGTYTLRFYTGANDSSSAASATLSVAQATTTTLTRHTGTGSSTTYGDSLSFDVTVNAGATGTVTLKDGGASGTTIGSGDLTGGSCTITPLLNALTAGSHTNIVAVYSGDATNGASTSSPLSAQTVSQKSLTAGLTGTVSKTYDGATTATLAAGNYALPGVISGDTVTLNNPTAGTYDTRAAGTAKTVNVTGLSISGASSANYILSSTSASGTVGSITARAITVTAATNSKTYDGTTSAAATPTITSGSLVTGDTANFTESYSNENVGAGNKTLVPSGTVTDGNSGSNYNVTFANNTTGTITARAITVTAATNSKGYDGTTSAAATPTITSGSLATGDVANFTEAYSSKNVGAANRTLVPSGTVTDGNSGNNYTVTFANNTTGTITARAITVTAAANSKGYDGTTSAAATPTITSGSLAIGDTANFTEAYADKNVGAGNKTIAPAGTVTDGNSGNNYTVTFANSTTGTITARAITVTAATNSKGYDGTTSATATPTITSGSLVAGDTANFTEAYADRNVGSGNKTLAPAGTVTDGNSGNNYAVTFANRTTGTITARAITVTAATNSKGYDGTTSAAATPTITSGSLATGDTANFTEAYSSKNVGAANRTLVPSGTVTDGNSGNNYTVTFTNSTTGTITARAITVTAAANSKGYDGTTSAAATPTITSGSLATGDTANFTEAYSNKNVGSGNKTLAPAGTVTDGNSGNNYTVTFANNTTGTITARAITVTAATNSKVYDATTSAAATPTITSGTLVGGDVANFTESYSNGNVGAANKTLIPAGTVTDGNGGSNYNVTFANNTTGTISARGLTVAGITANNKSYDGGLTASLNTTSAVLSGLQGTDTVILNAASGVGAFVSSNVGSGITVNVSGLTLTQSGSNYTLTQPTGLTANITPAALTVTANNQSKTYDGQVFSGFTVGYSGFVNGETASVLGGALTFGDAASAVNAGTSTITPGGLTSSNYAITFATGTLTINKAEQTITWANPADIVYGTALGADQLNATVAGVAGGSAAGALSYTQAAGTLLNAGNNQTLTVNAAATTNYNAATKSVTINVAKATPILTWNDPAAIKVGTPLGASQLDATANVPGIFDYSQNPAGAVLSAGHHKLNVTFIPSDTQNYNTVYQDPYIDVAKVVDNGVVINDGAAQRSTVNKITITFDYSVSLSASEVSLLVLQGSAGNTAGTQITPVVQTTDNKTFTLIFGAGLKDGVYQLGVANTGSSLKFHRLFGDLNGDRTVSGTEITAILKANMTSSLLYDLNGTGIVTKSDVLLAQANCGKKYSY